MKLKIIKADFAKCFSDCKSSFTTEIRDLRAELNEENVPYLSETDEQ